MERRENQAGTKRTPLVPRVKVWLETEGHYALGFGLCQILEAVAQAGSIKQGARDLGKSYRHVWGRIKEAERALAQRLVEARVGGQGLERSALTPMARQLVNDFLAVRLRVQEIAAEEFARRFTWPILSRKCDS